MPLYILQLLVLIVHLQLLSLYSLALHLLVRRVLADERETAVHLGQVLGTEDKHQLVLHRMMPAHISHRTDILVLSILQLLLKRSSTVPAGYRCFHRYDEYPSRYASIFF